MLNTDPMRRRLALGAGLVSLVLAASACASTGSSSAPAATQTTAESVAASESAAESTAEGPSITITSTSSFGAAEVTVEVGSTDRVVRVHGGSRGLSFTPAITSRAFRVSLLPDLAAARDACVDRIELRRAGAPVATIVP